MKDKDKTKEQLINELVKLRQRLAELEAMLAAAGIHPCRAAKRQLLIAGYQLQYFTNPFLQSCQ